GQCETPDRASRKGYEEAMADDGRRARQRPSQLHRRLSIANRLVSSLAALVTPYGQHPAGSGAGNLVNVNTVGARQEVCGDGASRERSGVNRVDDAPLAVFLVPIVAAVDDTQTAAA